MQKRSIPQAVWNSPEAIAADKAGHRLACEELARKHPRDLDEGNPNHPRYEMLFGYERDEFMAKQYKES